MRTHLVLASAAALMAATALAQQPSRDGIAQLKGVKGNVLLSREAGLAAGGEAARVMDRTRVITTANSEVVVVYDNGCEVRLKENQRFEVDSRKPCEALVASVESILVQPAELAAAGGYWAVVPVILGGLFGAPVVLPGGPSVGVNLRGPGGPTPTPLSPS
jgi:hypothetical protein